MQSKILWFGIVLVWVSSLQVNAQHTKMEATYRKWFVGSTFLLLGNLDKM